MLLVAAVLVATWYRAVALEAGCPGYSSDHRPKGVTSAPTIVTYSYDASIGDATAFNCRGMDTQQAQIEKAIAQWNSENQRNCSNVQFTRTTGAAQLTFRNLNQETLTTIGGSELAGGDATKWPNTRMFIDFFPNAKCSGNELGRCVFCDVGNGGDAVNTVWQKVALHDLGHTMGLDDINSGSAGSCDGTGLGKSVMDRFVCRPDDVNDYRGSQSVEISPCDHDAVVSAYGTGSTGCGGSHC